MCLSIPSKVIEIDKEENTAIVDTMGVRRKASIEFVADEVKVGDYVLIHIGYAMNIIDEEYAEESLKLYREIIASMEEEDRRAMIEESDQCPGGAV
ncbi:HypC/HybG/HupF family hydrogenase formation chaperone [Hydrogenimonas sp.]|jgi:hydrogenase expression/formation protein HypC